MPRKLKRGACPSSVTVSDAFTSRLVSLRGHWKRVTSRNARLRKSPREKGQPASQPASQSSMLVFQPRTAQPFPKRRECYMQLALQHVRSESSSLQYIHTVYTGYMHLLVLYPLRAELTILGSTIAHCPTYTTIWHSVPIKTLSRFFFFLNNAGPTSTLIRWSLLGCSKTEKPKNRRSQKSAKQCIPLSYIKNPTHGIVQ